MDRELGKAAEKFHIRHRWNRIWKRLAGILGCVVVFCTTYALILPAITMERETVCGLQEHQHTDSCYTLQAGKRLACTPQSIGVHTHTAQCADGSCGYADFVIHEHDASCYDASGKLVCSLPEIQAHTHSASCYRIPTRVVGEHTHTEDCYTLQRGALVCGLTETDGHTHTDSCHGQRQVLCCTTPESDGHQHGEGCYGEDGALICTKAESAGHHHGAECYRTEEVLTCGQEEAQPHHHTDACYAWEKTLTCGMEEGAIYERGEPELICTKREIKPHRHTAACFDAAGNWICGQPEVLTHTHSDACFETAEEKVLTCTLEEHTHSEDCYPADEPEEATEESLAVMPFGVQVGETAPVYYEGTLLPMPTLSGNNTTYDPKTDTFQTQVRIDFQFDSKPVADQTYTYTYPAGIAVPDDYVGKDLTLLDGDKQSGTYRFTQNEDGTYTVEVKFDQAYINGASNNVNGYVQFTGTFTKANMDDKGNIVVGGTDDSITLVPGNKIKYPEDSTESYNIDVSKSGTWVKEEDKLVYTVYVRTTKGTPNPISFTDAMTIPNGLTLGTPEIVVEKGTAQYYYQSWDNTWGYTDKNDWVVIESHLSYDTGGKLSGSLPGLSATQADNANGTSDVYKITYSYPITDQTVGEVKPDNSVTVSARDETKGQTVTDSATSTVTVNKDFSYTIEKSGAIASDKPGYIKWTVTVNRNGQNLAGATLTDEMLKSAVDLTVTASDGSANGYSYVQSTGTITFNAVGDASNKNTYTITYYIPVEESWNGTTVKNEATLDPDPDKPDDEKKADATVTVSGVQFDKSGSHNATTNKLDWVITINSGKLDIAGATLTDDMFAALSDAEFSIEPSDGYEFTKEGGKITGITFKEVSDGKNTQSYTIKYSTEIPKDENGNPVTSVTNTATLTPKAGKGNPITENPTVTVEKPSLAKGGSYDSYNGVINWTVTVNDNGKNIAGAVFTDSMLGQLTAGQITVKYNNGQAATTAEYTIVQGDNGKVTQITFNAIEATGVNTNKYVVTYQTAALQEWDNRTVSNEANLSLNGTPVTAEVTVPGGGNVEKKAGTGTVSEDGKTLTIPWTVTLNVPKGGLAAGTTIEDDVTRNQYNNTNPNQWMTRSQILNWADSWCWLKEDGSEHSKYTPPEENVNFLASNGNSYSYQQIRAYSSTEEEGQTDLDALTYTKFTVSYPDGLVPPEGATKLTFTYSTTANLANAGTGQNKFYNDVKVGGKENGAEYTYHKAGVTKTDGNGNTATTQVSNEGALTWKVTAIVGAGNKKLTLEDTLPGGVTLESLQLTGWGNLNMELTTSEDGTISGTDSTNQYNVSGTYRDGVITLDIVPYYENNTISSGAEFTLTVNCQVTDAASQTGTKILTNDVTMKLDDVEIGSSSQTQEWTYHQEEVVTKVVDKIGRWDNGNRILNYTIVLNPEGKDLVDGSDTLTLVDTMTYTNQIWLEWNIAWDNKIAYSIDASLMQSTVKLSEAVWSDEKKDWVAGEAINNWSWTYEAKTGENNWDQNQATNTITGNGIPDKTPLLLQYSYRVSSNVPDKINGVETSFQLQLTNKAELAGESDTNTTSGDEMVWKHSDVAAGVTTDKSYSFYKVEAGNYNVSLAGATFTVYRYDTATGQWEKTPVKTYLTDASGFFKITRQEKDANDNVTFAYDANTLYKVVETAPPEGYKLPDSVKTYYFYFRDTGDTAHTLPTLPDDAVDLSAESKTVYVENVKNTTEITVNKVWKNHDGSDANTSGKPPVTIQLYRKTTQGSSSGGSGGGSGGTTGGTQVSITASGNGSDASSKLNVTEVAAGSKIRIKLELNYAIGESWNWTPTVTVTGVNGNAMDGWILADSSANGHATYTYEGQVIGEVTISCENGSSDIYGIYITVLEQPTISDPDDTGDNDTPTTPEDSPYRTVTLNTGDIGWSHTFTNLPLTGTDENGNTVNYYYYVVETPVTNYDVSYDNNSGIQSGAITVTNTATDNPEYVLPETGGGGTMGYTLGGFALTAGAALWLLARKKRRREAA